MKQLSALFDQRAKANAPVEFWLRDDDASKPTTALARLLKLTKNHTIPLTLAVIPALTNKSLAQYLQGFPDTTIATHGWSHQNHAPPHQKKCELGTHRPLAGLFSELHKGQEKLARLFGGQSLPVLVPPWNRIAPEVISGLTSHGFCALSIFGAENHHPIRQINTHIDLIDWKGTRGGRSEAALVSDVIRCMSNHTRPIGLLTHHLVHDATAWGFLEQFFALSATHPGCRWLGLRDMLAL